MKALFRAIADPTRREILDTLVAKHEESVMELTKDFDMSLPALSQHLKVLRNAGLIAGRREGRQIFYRLNPAPLYEVARWIHPYERFWKSKLNALDAHLRRRHGQHRS
jgi:DNA-binding transcriptional ArsR family regulator